MSWADTRRGGECPHQHKCSFFYFSEIFSVFNVVGLLFEVVHPLLKITLGLIMHGCMCLFGCSQYGFHRSVACLKYFSMNLHIRQLIKSYHFDHADMRICLHSFPNIQQLGHVYSLKLPSSKEKPSL